MADAGLLIAAAAGLTLAALAARTSLAGLTTPLEALVLTVLAPAATDPALQALATPWLDASSTTDLALDARLPLWITPGGLIAISLAGAGIPVAIGLLWVHRSRAGWPAVAAGSLAVAITALLTTTVGTAGVSAPYPQALLPPAVALAAGILLGRGRAATAVPLALACGSIGTLAGADLAHLPQLAALLEPATPRLITLGGAGATDLVYIAGVIPATLLALLALGTRPPPDARPRVILDPQQLPPDQAHLRDAHAKLRQNAWDRALQILGRPARHAPGPDDVARAFHDATANLPPGTPGTGPGPVAAAGPRVPMLHRTVAYLLDSLLLLPVLLILVLLTQALAAGSLRIDNVVIMWVTPVSLLYFGLAEGLYGTTLAKHALGIRVISRRGGGAVTRNLARLAWSLPGLLGPLMLAVDFLLMLRSEAGQRLGDMAGHTWTERATLDAPLLTLLPGRRDSWQR